MVHSSLISTLTSGFKTNLRMKKTVCKYAQIRSWIFVCMFIILTSACKDPFEADVKFQESNFLVVEGYINIGPGVTKIKLSRTSPLKVGGQRPELNAQIYIENGNNDLFSLSENNPGVYASDSLYLTSDQKYRIVIITADEEQYASEYVTPIQTPTIDSVSWTDTFEGVNIYVSTHDSSSSVRYFQWNYDQTWEILSRHKSYVRYEYPSLIYRSEEETESLYRCWKYASNPDMLTASTVALSESIIREKPLVFIPAFIDDRLTVRYSILVKQHALSQKEFEFLQLINKNSSNLGTFFDAQPSQVFGNIKSQTSNKQVIGFVSAYTTTSKQLIIINYDMLNWRYTQFCDIRQIPNDSLSYYSRYYTTTNMWVVGEDDQIIILGAYAATHGCVDCHSRGGTNIRPPFWPVNIIE